jgi:hypothetical protein
MTEQNDSIGSLSAPSQSSRGSWRYFALFGIQTIGVAILFWNGVPLYQEVLADPASFEPRPEPLIWGLSSIALMQIGYWISDRVRPAPPRLANRLLGHVTLFVGRMSFVLATSVFSFLFIAQKPGFHLPVSRYVIALFGLFSLYCYTRELERLGRALLTRERPEAS